MNVNQRLSEDTIISEVADRACRQITRKAIAALRAIKDVLSGDDSALVNAWDEICVQIQGEQSLYWDAYEETVRGVVTSALSGLAPFELDAIWLQTQEGQEWSCDDEEDREPDPVCEEHIAEYIAAEYVYAEAGSWTNRRIRAYLDRWS
jgi:hypothetical protein